MPKPIFDSRGNKYSYREKGKDVPVYVVFAKSEITAHRRLSELLTKLNLSVILDNIELINETIENE